jgi:hypothetical protein
MNELELYDPEKHGPIMVYGRPLMACEFGRLKTWTNGKYHQYSEAVDGPFYVAKAATSST